MASVSLMNVSTALLYFGVGMTLGSLGVCIYYLISKGRQGLVVHPSMFTPGVIGIMCIVFACLLRQ